MTAERPSDTREWGRFTVDLPTHPKLAALEDPAPHGWALVVAVLYCVRNRTDGEFPLAGVLREACVSPAVGSVLVEVKAWHLPGHGCDRCPQPRAGYAWAHDFLKHNRSAAQVEAARVAGRKAANARHGRRRSGTSEDPSCDSHADRNAESVRNSGASDVDVTEAADRTAVGMRSACDPQESCGSHCGPHADLHADLHAEVEVEKEVTTNPPALRAGPPARADRGSALDREWRPAVEVRDQLAVECPGVDLAREFRKFQDYWTAIPGQRGRKKDWDGTFRNWIRRAAENASPAPGRGSARQSKDAAAAAAVARVRARHGADVIALPTALGGAR